jgi:hypothetical protein
MPLSASFFRDETFVFLFRALSALLVVALVCFTVWLVRTAKHRIGNKAYWLAPVPFVSVLLAAYGFFLAQTPNAGPPFVLSESQLVAMIKALPASASFDYSGLAFYKGKFYAASNLGLLELEQGRVARFYRFQKNYSVVSGPWLDRANQLLWVLDDRTNQLVNYNGTVWHRVSLPEPRKGHYGRGDVLDGIKPASNAKGFWIQAGGTVWRWDSARNEWVFEPQPAPPVPSSDSRVTIGVLPIGTTPLLIVRHELLSFLVKDSQDFNSDTVVTGGGEGTVIPSNAGIKFFAKNWVVADDSGYICTRSGDILKVTSQTITKVDAPGNCETLAIAEPGILLASFRGKGIYEYTDNWRLRAVDPYAAGEGEYWAHLRGDGAELAFAITGKPVIDKEHSSGTDMKFIRNAPTSLWYSRGAALQIVDIR